MKRPSLTLTSTVISVTPPPQIESSEKRDSKLSTLRRNIILSFEKFTSQLGLKEASILIDNLGTILDFIDKDFDSIWTYILRNMFKPFVISNNKVDVVIGKPPWSTLQFMKDKACQKYLKTRSLNYLLPGRAQKVLSVFRTLPR